MNYKHYFISLFLSGALIAQEQPKSTQDTKSTQTPAEILAKSDQTTVAITPSNVALPSDTYFITASRSDRAPETLAANVTIIGPEKIAKSNARNVAELVKYQAGVEFKNKSNTPNSHQIDVRGFGVVAAANTLILIDGRRINRPDMSSVDFSSIPVSRVEKIEIYRGGRSVLYGDNATGGVINIITKKQTKDSNKLTLNAEVGSYEYYRLGVSLDGFKNNLQYSFDTSYEESDGYHDNSSYRIKSTGFSVTSTEFEDLELHVSGGRTESHINYPGARNGDRDSASYTDYINDIRDTFIVFQPTYWINDDTNVSFTSSYSEKEVDPSGADSFLQERYITRDFEISPKLTLIRDIKGVTNTSVIGLDHRFSKMTNYGPEKDKRSTGVYIYNTSAFLDDSLFLDLGYRREKSRMNLNNGENYDDNDLDAFSAGLTYNYADQSKVFISYDRSFRTQRVDELGGAGFDELLDPQTSKTWQTGIKHRFTDRLSAELTVFHIDTQNEIFYDSTPGFRQNQSYDETTRVGAELGFEFNATENLSLFANYTYMEAELDKDSNTADANDGNTIPGVAEQFANFGFSWDFIDSWNLNMNAHWNDDQYAESDYANNADKQDSFITVDARVTYTWNWLSVYGGINNLFDEEYNEFTATYGEYTAPERNFVTGFIITHDF
jgi:iron complex outermembrane recepter protein